MNNFTGKGALGISIDEGVYETIGGVSSNALVLTGACKSAGKCVKIK